MTVYPPVPTSREELLIAALRHANEVSGTLNDIAAEVSRLLGDEADNPKYDRLHDLLLRRCDVNSGVFLFIAASNLRIEMPADLRGEVEACDDE
jgi:hypothetical protein